MKLIKWNPAFDSFLDDEDWGLMPMLKPNTFVPSLDIYQDKDNVIAKVALPGVDPEKISVSIENDVLTVESSMEKESEIDEKNYYKKEIRRGSFCRSVALPTSVDGDKAKAEYEKGILEIKIPKREEVKPKTVKIDVKSK
ncbi:MAG: Hsp20/alpha crystallin family protein [Patescibacteria group bacterium]|nr:Hsp20/alpha crystallin family protein [Patescibacteria group bacterium]